jgi:hypothetical protein
MPPISPDEASRLRSSIVQLACTQRGVSAWPSGFECNMRMRFPTTLEYASEHGFSCGFRCEDLGSATGDFLV